MRGKKYTKSAVLLAGLLFSFVFLVFIPVKVYGASGVPKILNYQGRLFDASENLLGGSGADYCFRFSIYDDAIVGAPDNKLWPSAASSVMIVNVKSGVFNVGIGDTSAGGDALNYNFQDNDSIFLNVEVVAQSGGSCVGAVFETLSPRQRIFASGYSINADTVGGFKAAESASGNQIPVLSSGNLIFGAASPQINATSSNVLSIQSNALSGNLLLNTLNGLVGIGTANPQAKLHVAGNGGLFNLEGVDHTYIQWYPQGLAAGRKAYTGFGGASSSVFTIANEIPGGAIVLSPTASGNVGIGTDFPSSKLEIVGGYATSSLSLGGFGLHLASGGAAPDSSQIWWGDNTGWRLNFGTKDASNNFQPRVTFLDTGQVGIGTAMPIEKLQLTNGNFLQDSPTDPKIIGGQNLILPGGGLQLNFVSGRYVYMIFDNAAGTDILRIVDATDPANPAVVGGGALSLPGSPRSIYVSGRYAYMTFRNIAGADVFRVVDISNPANPAVVGGGALNLPANGQHIFVSGHYAYITFDNGAGASTFRVIDISNPANPVVAGGAALSLPTSPRQIYVSGRYAYVVFYNTVSTDAFRVIDISNPANPVVAGGAVLSLGFSAWSIYVSGRYAYIGHDNNAGTDVFRIVDISNPANPAVVGGGALNLPGFAKSIFVSGRYAYVTFDNTGGANGFRIIDVSSPFAPAIVGGANLSLPGFPKSVFVNGRYAYFVFFQGVGTDLLRIVDVSGIEAVSALIHSLEAGSLQVAANAAIQNQLSVGGGLNIGGGGLYASGGAGITGDSLFMPLVDSTSTVRIQNATGDETLFSVNTINNRIKIGDSSGPVMPATLLVLDAKADAGDPAGVSGATYYNSNANKFRCFENGVWKDCDTAGGGGVTFRGYSLLRDAVGVTMTNAASGGTEITNLVSRRKIDFTGMTNARAQFAHSLNSATIKLRIDFSTDGCATFNATPLVSSFGAAAGANDIQVSSFAAIPAAAKADVCARAVIIGNGALDPIVRYITLDVN